MKVLFRAPMRIGAVLGIAGMLVISFFSVAGCSKITSFGKSGSVSEQKAAKYYCPMHPTYTSDKPGTCPICNMNLVPLVAHEDHSDHEMKPTDAQTVCLRHECPMIKAGETCPMLIVSETGETPECPVCQKSIAQNELKPVSSQLDGYAAVALTPAMRQMIGVKTDKVLPRDLHTSIRTNGLMLASPEMNLFVYESDLPRIANESRIRAYFPALGKELAGQVSRIPLSLDRGMDQSAYGASAVLSTSSSQIVVRARMEDPAHELRRGMTADVEVLTDLGKVTALPEEAVFFTGKRTLVFVERSEGVYEPREVQLGVRAEGFYAVKSGLQSGETVVTSGNFLIDSESRLQSAFAGAAAGGEKPSHAHGS